MNDATTTTNATTDETAAPDVIDTTTRAEREGDDGRRNEAAATTAPPATVGSYTDSEPEDQTRRSGPLSEMLGSMSRRAKTAIAAGTVAALLLGAVGGVTGGLVTAGMAAGGSTRSEVSQVADGSSSGPLSGQGGAPAGDATQGGEYGTGTKQGDVAAGGGGLQSTVPRSDAGQLVVPATPTGPTGGGPGGSTGGSSSTGTTQPGRTEQNKLAPVDPPAGPTT